MDTTECENNKKIRYVYFLIGLNQKSNISIRTTW